MRQVEDRSSQSAGIKLQLLVEMDPGTDLGCADRELEPDRHLALALEPAFEDRRGHALPDLLERGTELLGSAREREARALHDTLGMEVRRLEPGDPSAAL